MNICPTKGRTVIAQKLSAIKELPDGLQRWVFICVAIFVVEIFFVAVSAALDIPSIRDSPLLGGVLRTFSKTVAFMTFWQVYHFVYLASVGLYVSTIYRVSGYFLRRSRNRMDAINQSSAVVRLSVNGTLLEVNDIFCNIIGISRDELVGKHHRAVVPDHLTGNGEYDRFWATLESGEMVSGLFERRGAGGRQVWVRGTYHPIRNRQNQIYEILKIATDETGRVQAQADLKTANTYLEHAAKILRHDMHSGINTYIPRAVTSLERRLASMPEAQESLQMPMRLLRAGLDHTQKIYRGVRAFTNLVRQGVDLERSDHDLQQILTSYLESTAYKSMVTIEPLVVASVNEALFCTAIDNFIRNGLAYNDSHTKHVTVKMMSEQVLVIIDNGRGMSQEDFEVYSKPYVRKGGQAEPGTGLGLNISIAILQEHGFLLSCDKIDDGGTQIKVRL